MGISILQASKSWGVSRTTIHSKLNTGEISRLSDKTIDPAEMSRVFGQPKRRTPVQNSSVEHRRTVLNTDLLEQKIAFLEQQRDEATRRAERAEERETRLLSQIDKLTETMKLLEAPKIETKPPDPIYTSQPIQEQNKPQKKGLFSRIFG